MAGVNQGRNTGFKVQGSGFRFRVLVQGFKVLVHDSGVVASSSGDVALSTCLPHYPSTQPIGSPHRAHDLRVVSSRHARLPKGTVAQVLCPDGPGFLQLAARHSKQPREISRPEPAESLGDVARRRSGGPADLTAIIEIPHRRLSCSNCKNSSLQLACQLPGNEILKAADHPTAQAWWVPSLDSGTPNLNLEP
jgi:hypothetical protein